MAGYDAASSQLGLPAIIAMLPGDFDPLTWWGWLLIVQAIILFALLDKVRKTGHVEAPAAPTDPHRRTIPKPDMHLDDVIERVRLSLEMRATANPSRAGQLPTLALEILDKVRMEEMTVWGRTGEYPSRPIGMFEWVNASLDIDKGEIAIPGDWGVRTYRDVHFVRAQVEKVWP